MFWKREDQSENLKWAAVSTGAALAAGLLMRSALKTGYEGIRKQPPPKNPYSPATGWSEALIWTAATGAGVGIGRLLARRGAALAWEKKTGSAPPERV